MHTPQPSTALVQTANVKLHQHTVSPTHTHHTLCSLQEFPLLSSHVSVLGCHFIVYLLNGTVYGLEHLILSTEQQFIGTIGSSNGAQYSDRFTQRQLRADS